METKSDSYHALLSALEWQIELGVTDTIGEMPVDRFEASVVPAKVIPLPEKTAPKAAPAVVAKPVESARLIAEKCQTLEELQKAVDAFTGSPLKAGARNTVFCDGNPEADLMVIGEAPGADEDRSGKPFVGKSGVLLDQMLAAIGLSRQADEPEKAAYISNVMFWRPGQNRTPSVDEVTQLLPFTKRHIELVKPKVLLLMGGTSAKHILNVETGITRLRGNWGECAMTATPAMPTLHPAYLLRTPIAKRMAWKDLIAVKERLS